LRTLQACSTSITDKLHERVSAPYGQELPAELPPETTEWRSSKVQRLLDAG
jgi:hypothetical protein